MSPVGITSEGKFFFGVKNFIAKKEEVPLKVSEEKEGWELCSSSPLHTPVRDELTAGSKRLRVTGDDHILLLPAWADESHNRVQGTCLGAEVRTIPEGFGSFSDAVKQELVG